MSVDVMSRKCYSYIPMASENSDRLQVPVDYNQFTGMTESAYTRPMDQLVLAVDPTDAVDYAAAGETVVSIVQKESPDLVLFPLRGAGPIRWVAESLLEHQGVTPPPFHDVPLGTHVDVSKGLLRGTLGLNRTQKTKILHETLQGLQDEGIYTPNKSQIMIVDEAQKGATISQAAHILKDVKAVFGDTSDSVIVALQDIRESQQGVERTDAYRRLAANEWAGLRTYIVPTKLFTVDVTKFLDVVVSDINGGNGTLLYRFQTLQNEEARMLFAALGHTYSSPEGGRQELAQLRAGDFLSLGATAVQNTIIEAITDPRRVERRATEAQMESWWDRFILEAAQHHG